MFKLKNQKKVFFYALMVILPYLVLALLELVLRLFTYGDDLSLFIPSSDPKYYEINRLVGERFFSKYKSTTPLSEKFLKEKPDNGYRIFVLGESSVQGFPYDANIAFTRILQRRLQNIFPNRSIEVVNLGLTAVNSYTLLDFTDELLQQKPDAVLIYAGHNEYYGALGVASMENGSIPPWLKKLHLKIIHVRTYQLLQNGIANIYKFIHPATEDEAKATVMEKMVGKNLIPYNSKMYLDGLAQFSDNMGDLLGKLKEAHVPVIISDLVSNVRDTPPFRSSRYEIYPKADSLFSDAKRFDADHVFDKAKEEYIRAKDLDLIRFRASEDINKIIAKLADSLGMYHLSLKSLFEKYSPQDIVGNNLMTDHLHPNVDGYFLMAEGFLNALRDHGMIENYWDSTRMRSWTYYRNNWGFTELDSMIAVIRIKHLKAGWPFQSETTINNFRTTYIPDGMIDSLAFTSIKYIDVTSSMLHKKLATYYESNGDFKRASKEYLSLAYIFPSDVSSYYYAADLAVKAKEYSNAIRYLQESPNADTSSYVQLSLASIYYSQKNNKEALACIDQLQKLHSDENNYLQVQKLKYNVQKDLGLSSDAEKTLAVIKKTDPSFNESRGGKSQVILIPNRIKPYLEKAETLRKNGKLSEAVSVLKEANNIREISYTNLLIGKLLFSQKNIEALYYLEKAHREIKDDPSLIYCLSILYIMKRDMPKAKEAIDEFARLEGKNHSQSERLRSLLRKQLQGKREIDK
jgi:tetratricopeptide (TPR) repeat protein/lysophospholipase L1-like esterase